jgi:hypothetical protein
MMSQTTIEKPDQAVMALLSHLFVEPRRIDTVSAVFFPEAGRPIWRLEIDGIAIDFDHEPACLNAADAINARILAAQSLKLGRPLRWERSGSEHGMMAYSGDLVVGAIGRMADGSGKWHYGLYATSRTSGVTGDGRVASKAAAKRALARSWSAWCGKAGLSPA